MRVTGGVCRGRPLRAPRGASVRPTSDRVREALFSSLGDLTDDTVLDLYAGCGALGIEALSRGAARAWFVDRSPRCLACVRRNLVALGLEARARLRRSDVRRFLAQAGTGPDWTVDLAFLDPPYASDEVARALPELLDSGLLAPSARVVVETDRHVPPPDDGGEGDEGCARRSRARRWEKVFERVYGDTRITIFRVLATSTGSLDVDPQPEAV